MRRWEHRSARREGQKRRQPLIFIRDSKYQNWIQLIRLFWYFTCGWPTTWAWTCFAISRHYFGHSKVLSLWCSWTTRNFAYYMANLLKQVRTNCKWVLCDNLCMHLIAILRRQLLRVCNVVSGVLILHWWENYIELLNDEVLLTFTFISRLRYWLLKWVLLDLDMWLTDLCTYVWLIVPYVCPLCNLYRCLDMLCYRNSI